MKIRSVEVVSSSGSSVDSSTMSMEDGGGDQQSNDGSAGPLRRGTGRHRSGGSSSSAPVADSIESAAVQSLSIAMKELHTELRDKTAECEAMYETANAISAALQESERLLNEKTLECERLAMKLQMVTFREVDDDPTTMFNDEDQPSSTTTGRDVVEEAEEMLARSQEQATEAAAAAAKGEAKEGRAGTDKKDKKLKPAITSSKLNDVPGAVPIDEDVMPLKPQGRATHPGPVSVDSFGDEKTKSVVDSAGPRQAHFYQIIHERDKALQTVKKLSKEIKYARAKNKELKSKLERSTALNKLAYFKDKDDKSSSSSSSSRNKQSQQQQVQQYFPKQPLKSNERAPQQQQQQQQQRKSSLTLFRSNNSKDPLAQSPHGARQLSWLRRGKDSSAEQEQMVFSPTRDADFGKMAATEHEYLKAIAASDADHAAGVRLEW